MENTGLYSTADGGASWGPLSNNGLTGFSPEDFTITSNGRLLYAKGWPQGFLISIDDGATWDLLSSGVTNRNITGFLKSGTDIFAYGCGILKTTDNGSNWTEVSDCSYFFDNLLTNDGTNMLSVNRDYSTTPPTYNLYKSNDAGVNWTQMPISGMPSPDDSYIPEPKRDVYLGSGGNVFIRVYEWQNFNKNLLYKVDPTTGNATEIVSIPTTNSIESVSLFNGKLYVLTNNAKLHISTDAGQTWTTKNTSTSFGRLQIIGDNTFFILNNSIFLSTDGGDTWVNTGDPSGAGGNWYRAALISSANYSYIAKDRGLVYKSINQVIPPTAPSGLASFGNDRNSVGLIWNDNSSNETGFVIEASEGDNLNYDSVAFATRPSSWTRAQGVALISVINGASLKNNTTYFFRVRASGSGGKSAPSNEISVTTLVDCTPQSAIPTNRSWTATTLNQSGIGIQTKLNQTLNGANGNYTISDLPIGASSGLSPTPPDPRQMTFEENCGSVFLGSISFYLSNGNGTWDDTGKVLTLPWMTHPQYPLRTETTVYTLNAVDPPPVAPTNLAATVYLPGTILLNWTSGDFSQGFEVERSTTSGSGFAKIADVIFPKVSYKDEDPGLVIGTTYYYRVRASNAGGNSAYSAEVSIVPRSTYLFTPIDNLPLLTFFRTGGGGAWGDIDGDGINDLFLPTTTDSTGQNVIPPVVFLGLGNGQFTKLSIPELADEAITTRSLKIVDVNNDGLNDLLLTRSFSTDLLLVRNSDGSYTKQPFSEYTQGGLPGGSFADYDNDGSLDFLAHTSLGAGSATDKYLFHNNGDGTFTRITSGDLVTDFGNTRDAQWADYDNDGDMDILVLNVGTNPTSQSQTRLYQNDGTGNFTRVLGSVFESVVEDSDRTASWGDYDNDGDLDVFVASQFDSPPDYGNNLFRNNGDGTFTEVVGSVVSESGLGGTFGSAWADIDNDGDLDLFSMGFTSALYYNNGDGTFSKYTTPELFNAPNLSKLYGPALEDVDDDGFLDFHNGGFSNPDIPNIIYRNTTAPSAARKWVKFNLTGTISNTNAIGARIYVKTGLKTQMREIQSHTAHATQSSLTAHFGIGSAATIDEVRIVWPSSGIEQFLYNVTPNQTINVIEDGDPPVITTLAPADGASILPGLTELAITFDEEPFAVAAKRIKLYRVGNATPISDLLVTSGTKSGNTYTYSINQLNSIGDYYVQFDQYAFDDMWANSHAGITDQTTWNFTVNDTPPVVTSHVPDAGAQIAPGLTSISVTFDEEVFPVAGGVIGLVRHSPVGSTVQAWNPSEATKTGNTLTFNLGTPLLSIGEFELTIDGMSFNNINGTFFDGLSMMFDVVDNTKPSITFTPPQTFEKGSGSVDLTITANDNGLLARATMHYKKMGSTATPTAGTPITITGTTSQATFTAQEAWFDEQGMEYFFKVQDEQGNEETSQTYRTYMLYSGTNAPSLPSQGGGGEVASYRIIAIPYFDNKNTSQLFEELGNQDKKQWRLLGYQNSPEAWVDYPGTISRGKGYFLNMAVPTTISIGDAQAPSTNPAFNMTLVNGFNLIGNPYTFAIDWNDVVAANPGVSVDNPLIFQGSYSSVTSLNVFQGAFVFSNGGGTLQIPVINGAGGRKGPPVVSATLDGVEWEVAFTITQNNIENKLGAVGMRPDAKETQKDRFDQVTPPRWFDYLEVNFPHPEFLSGKRFSKDIVPTQEEYTWDFTIESNLDGVATIEWDNTGFGENAKELYLFDNDLQIPVNMREANSYSFEGKSSKSLTIFFGNDLSEKVKPNKVVLGQAYPNPTTGVSIIPYTIPEQGSEAIVTLDVFDMTGHRVSRLVNAALKGGFYQSSWDALLTNSADGLYTYRLIVNNEVHTGKIILKK
ncbi:MAG: FG-GAP-like repeat-containing protein [Cyclobacteriaceae bacterium]